VNVSFKRRWRIGRDRDPGVAEAIIMAGMPRSYDGTPKSNPLVLVYGEGPDGAICGHCEHLFAQGGTQRTYYKCDLRRVTHGPVTDHRFRWQACAEFVERTVPHEEEHATHGQSGEA
jgi:hypothetical protein